MVVGGGGRGLRRGAGKSGSGWKGWGGGGGWMC